MKIIVNVARELLDKATEWTPCEGVRLQEQDDGSFSLYMTDDLERAQKAASDHAAAKARLADMAPGKRTTGAS